MAYIGQSTGQLWQSMIIKSLKACGVSKRKTVESIPEVLDYGFVKEPGMVANMRELLQTQKNTSRKDPYDTNNALKSTYKL